ncbi:hypothetical protein chiPu_0021962, partial [Chiloscyllium punctatum]|nr:hypothetical protein [Chiloscyllium punctatum]
MQSLRPLPNNICLKMKLSYYDEGDTLKEFKMSLLLPVLADGEFGEPDLGYEIIGEENPEREAVRNQV